ncbi:hypothetical protein GHT09_018934 [Marmota monax]|uniref:Uncharacterized protein n=1 Tax=Marmota monax TaxID=9995 RepID=A0A834URZ6_MARMO|nr:hypothetical protein GHT09_018934 [Marmota monax]
MPMDMMLEKATAINNPPHRGAEGKKWTSDKLHQGDLSTLHPSHWVPEGQASWDDHLEEATGQLSQHWHRRRRRKEGVDETRREEVNVPTTGEKETHEGLPRMS